VGHFEDSGKGAMNRAMFTPGILVYTNIKITCGITCGIRLRLKNVARGSWADVFSCVGPRAAFPARPERLAIGSCGRVFQVGWAVAKPNSAAPLARGPSDQTNVWEEGKA
jgi:hypothetical protein